jgi:chromosome segregation ATPase
MGESSLIMEKDKEIERLRAQLGEALAEAESAKAREEKVAQDKVSMLADLRYARSKLREMQADKVWAVRFLNEQKDVHVAHIEQFRERIDKLVQTQEEKLRALSIEYDEELYPHLMSTIAERRYSFTFFLCHTVFNYF